MSSNQNTIYEKPADFMTENAIRLGQISVEESLSTPQPEIEILFNSKSEEMIKKLTNMLGQSMKQIVTTMAIYYLNYYLEKNYDISSIKFESAIEDKSHPSNSSNYKANNKQNKPQKFQLTELNHHTLNQIAKKLQKTPAECILMGLEILYKNLYINQK